MDLLTILRIAPWAIAALAIGFGLLEESNYEGLKASNATAVADAQRRADDLANQLITAENAARDATAKTVTVYQDRIVHAPQTNSCGPALRDAADGVRAILGGDSPQGK